MPAEEVYELFDLEVDEVSLVDHPANRRRFLIVKREEGSEVADQANAAGVPGWEDPGTWAVLFEMVAEGRSSVSKQMELFVSGVVTTEADIQLDQEVTGRFSGKVLSTYGSYLPGPVPTPYQRPGLLKVEGVIELPQGLKLGQEFEAPGRFTFTAPYGRPDAVPTREVKVAGKLVLPEGRALDEGGEVQVFLRNFPPAGYAYPHPYPYPYPYPYPAPVKAEAKDEASAATVELALPEEFRKAIEEAAAAVRTVSEAVESLKSDLHRVSEDLAALSKRVEALEKTVPTSKRLTGDEGKDEKRGFWDGVVPRIRR